MGLLTNSKQRSKVASLLNKFCHPISVLAYIAGVVWLGLLALDTFNNKTYFSENALLPGLVKREFNYGTYTQRLLESLKEEANSRPDIPYSWIQGQFRQIGLDVYFHNFTLHYPFGVRPKYLGKNIYAILRAPRAAGNEALVLSTPYRNLDSPHGSTLPGISLMLSLAKFFRKYTFWAKDIIFLITEHEMVGLQAWLEAYHSSYKNLDVLNSGILEGRSGAIQAALNLEISEEKMTHFDIKIEGLNGHLPNLDLFNLVTDLNSRESIPTTFQEKMDHYDPSSWNGWRHTSGALLSFMMNQATGLPTGGHGLFNSYSIQSLTIKSIKKGFSHNKITFNHMGRVLEGVFRSLNNLLERFHQSFFFYLLPSTRRFISIGIYMLPFALMGLPLLLKALSLYLSLGEDLDKKKEELAKKEDADHAALMITQGPSLWSSLIPVILCHLAGLVILFIPSHLHLLPQWINLSLEDTLYHILTSYLTIIILIPALDFSSRTDTRVYKCIALLELALLLYSLSLVNISLAVFLVLIYVPFTTTAGACQSKILRTIHSLFLLAANPFILSYLALCINSYVIDPNATLQSHLSRAYSGHKKVVLFSLEDWYLFNNWSFIAATLLLFPVWLQFWILRKPAKV